MRDKHASWRHKISVSIRHVMTVILATITGISTVLSGGVVPAFADGSCRQFSVGQYLDYERLGSHWRPRKFGGAGAMWTNQMMYTGGDARDKGFVFCVDPVHPTPPVGIVNKQCNYHTVGGNLRKAAYFSLGAPGWSKLARAIGWWGADSRPDPSVDLQGQDANSYIFCHILLSYIAGSDTWARGIGDDMQALIRQAADYIFNAHPNMGNFEAIMWDNAGITLDHFDYNPWTKKQRVIPKGSRFHQVQRLIGYRYGGSLKIRKHAARKDITSGNPLYTIEGTRYAVVDENGITVAYLTVNASGWSDKINLPFGTYTIREVEPNDSYCVNTATQTVEVDGDKVVELDPEMDEQPVMDPINLLIQKAIAENPRRAGEPQGDIPTLAGIKFRVTYYKGLFNSVEEAQASGTQAASAVFETDANGNLNFERDTPVDGTFWPYQDEIGRNEMPLGTFTVQEVSALEGLKVSNGIALGHVIATPAGPQVVPVVGFSNKETPAVGSFDDATFYGGVKVVKADGDWHKSSPQGDATLAGVNFDIVNKSMNPVWVGGKEYQPGQVVATISAAENGGTYFAVSGNILPYGTYEIHESGAGVGYRLNSEWSQTFEIRQDGQTVAFELPSNWNENDVQRGGVKVVKADQDMLVSGPQGDGTLAGVKYEIKNRSRNPIVFAGKTFAPGELITTITTAFDAASNQYVASLPASALPYGTYEITEVATSTGYHNANWHQTFEIRTDGEIKKFTSVDTNWNTNKVMRGGVRVVKADHDLHKSIPQGDADLEKVQYNIINRSQHVVERDGKTYKPGDVVMTITSAWNEQKKVYEALSGNVLPYGTYEIQEIKTSEGYLIIPWTQQFTIRKEGELKEFDSVEHKWNENKVQRGGVRVTKADKDMNVSIPQGDASLDGVKYEIVNKSKRAVYVNGKIYQNGDVITTIVTAWSEPDKMHLAFLPKDTLPYGTYLIREVAVGEGYHNAKWEKTFSIRQDGFVQEYTTSEKQWNTNKVMRGGVRVVKADHDLHRSYAQGDATLNGVKYDIINRSKSVVERDGKIYKPGEVVMTITTKWNEQTKLYEAVSGNVLPYGTYEIKEVQPSVGYLNAGWDKTFVIRKEGDLKEFKDIKSEWNENAVIRGGVIVSKVDRETHQYLPLGEAHLDGAKFDIVNKSKANVYVNGKEYKVGDVVTTITAFYDKKTNKYIAQTKPDTLPYGTYEIHEVATGTGYLFDTQSRGYSFTFQIRENGKMVDLTRKAGAHEGGKAVFENKVQREDWNFKKKDAETMERMDHVVFTVTSNTTGETHVIVTDENGIWGSAYNQNTHNTNANDPDSPITNGAVIKNDKGEYIVKDTKKLDTTAGTYFTGLKPGIAKWAKDGKSYDVNGYKVVVRDDRRSFPYDTYTVKELPSDKNRRHRMVKFTVTLHKYGNPDGPGIDTDYGTVDNHPLQQLNPEVSTTLTYKKGKIVNPERKAELIDKVTYKDLDDGNYVVKGEIHVVNKDGSDGGIIARASKPLVINDAGVKGKSGSIDVPFTVDTTSLEDKKLVAYEYIMLDNQIIVKHEDLKDEGQTVTVAKKPSIHTELTDGKGNHEVAPAQKITLVDTVEYHNLKPGKKYTMHGKLHLRIVDANGNVTDGGVLKDKDGKEVEASSDFTPTEPNGKVDITFTFEMDSIAGKSVVAFEELHDGKILVTTHTDIHDHGQTVHFPPKPPSHPEVHTTATDGPNGTHNVSDSGEKVLHVVINDEVAYSGLTPGKKYTVSGTLHKRSVGEDGKMVDDGVLKDVNGKEVTASAEVTPDKPDGKVNVQFIFDINADELNGKTVVAFEDLRHEGAVVATHADINDEGQSVHKLKIGTTLTGADKSGKTVASDSEIELIDTVSYENLIPGQEYTIEGKLVNKDGDQVMDKDNKPSVASTTFTPDKANGTVDIKFTVDTSKMHDGDKLVAFEYAYVTNNGQKFMIGHHVDINDEGQTVKVEVESPTPKVTLETSAKNMMLPVAIIGGVIALGALTTIVYVHKRKGDREESKK